jgi:ABC-2 type transport system permease protein
MSTLAGTGKLVRLILRRDRVILPLWMLSFTLVLVGFVSSFAQLFPTAADRQQYAATSATNAAFVALYGRLYGSSLAELVAWRAGFFPLLVGLASLLTVVRHTRTEEETGRRELLGATVVGRHAGLAAALIATLGANLLLAVLVAAGMISQGLPAAGSVAFGLELAAAGWAFAAVGGVAAQLTSGAGGARGIAVSALGIAYLLRLGGDVSGSAGGGLSWLSWLSPIGWAHRIRPYAGERWVVLALPVAFTAVGVVVAVILSVRRDVGTGLLVPRPGPATAAAGLRSPLALAWRLHRGLLAAWTAGFAVVGAVLGAVTSSVGDLVAGNQNLEEVFARLGGRAGLIDAYLASILGLLGLFAATHAIQATLRLRAEETSGRAEPVLAAAVGRLSWAGGHLVFSLLGPAALLLVAGLTCGLTFGLSAGDVGRQVPRLLAGAVMQLPAVWVLAAIAVALVGLLPRLAAASWGVLAACLLIGLVGAALQLRQWLLDVSPFTHVPKYPGGAVTAAPLILLVVVAVTVTAVGLAGLHRRDLPV